MTLDYKIAIAALLLGLQLGACGDDSDFVSTGEGRDRELPSDDPLDGSTLLDGSTSIDGAMSMDGSALGDGAAELDAGTYLDNLPDGSVVLDDGGILLPDGEVIDEMTAEMRFGPEVDVSACAVSELDLLQADVQFGDEGGFALVPGFSTGFGLAFRAQTMGNCLDNVGVAHLPSLGAFPTPEPVLPDCPAVRDVALLARRDHWQLAWVDNITGSAELHAMALDDDMRPMGGFERETITDSDDEMETKPVLAEIAGHTLLSWIADDDDADQHRVMAKFLDGPDTDMFAMVDDSEQAPQALAVSRMGLENRGALAWVGPVSNPGVWLQTLDEAGKPAGAPHKLTERVGASSSVDLAPRNDGGGAVYSIVIDGLPQVRFRRIDTLGAPRDDERALVAPPFRAQDASLAAIGGGYAVAYRALPGEGQENPEIRLMFVTREGNVARDDAGRPVSFLIAESTVSTGRTYVEIAVDGQIMIGWLDAGGESGSNVLKVARRRLDCGM